MSEYKEFLTEKYREQVLKSESEASEREKRRKQSFQQFIFSCIYKNNSNIIKFVENGEHVDKDRKSYFLFASQRGSLDEVKELLTSLGCEIIRDFSKPPKILNPFSYIFWLISNKNGCMFDISILKNAAPLETKVDDYDAL